MRPVRSAMMAFVLGVAGCGAPRVTTIVHEPKSQVSSPLDSLVHIGDSMREDGALQEAADMYAAAVKRDPQAPVPLIRLGEVELELGLVAQAQQAFRDALTLAPGNDTAKADLAIALLASGAPADALPIIEPVARTSRDARVLRNYGVTLDMLGRSAEAQAAYRRALAQFPADADLHNNLALSLAVSGDLAGAQREMEAAVNTPNAPAHVADSRVMLLAMAGQEGQARSAGQRLADPASADGLIQRGQRAATATSPAERATVLGLVSASSPGPTPGSAPSASPARPTAAPPAPRRPVRAAAAAPAASPPQPPSPPSPSPSPNP